MSAERNPFHAGTGTDPPVLAGRDAHLASLRRLLDGLADGSLKQTIHLMQAPRGLGKTVLLSALERDASKRAGAAVLRTSGGSFPGLEELARLVEPTRTIWARGLRWFPGLSLFGLRVERPAGVATDPGDLGRALRRRKGQPLLVAIDEAHMLPPDVCRTLLNVFQLVTGDAHCALLLVGTPGLQPLLLSPEVGASFAERAPVIEPGLLLAEESVAALHVPQWRDWTIDESVLATVAGDALGYPYFLQLWGEQLWQAGLERRTVDTEALERARTEVDRIRDRFYAARFDEFERFAERHGLHRDGLLATVQRIAPTVANRGSSISTGQVNSACESGGLPSEQTTLAKRCFIDNGFLTRSGDDWQAAIPSLATYIRDHPR